MDMSGQPDHRPFYKAAAYFCFMTFPHLLRKAWQLHLLIWLGFATYEQSILLFTNNTQFNLFPILLNYLLNAVLFYTNSMLLLPRLHAQHRQWLYVGFMVVLLMVYAVLRSELYLLSGQRHLDAPASYSYEQFWLLSLYRGSFFLFVSIGYWFARNAIALETQKHVQEQHLRTAERNLMEANLAFLKSQINPHFLFNSLNFLYAQVYPYSENAAKAILLLSDTMRYALHEDNYDKVLLTQEIQHLHNYIALNQLRFNSQLQIDFKIIGNPQFLMILPLVLITFIENCFKHGELTDPNNPLTIHLALVQNQFTFQTRNKKRYGPKEKSTSIGIVNTRKRLEIAYGKRFELRLLNESDYYTCNLTMEL
jgi:two-component system LytT family sensor kinase